ncbi:MAG: DUF896 domain-containing protein [Oscillospiraceae bacterium]|nr:DUF896 domain-containing protein [Oscillospiraceae bacterium]
MKQEKIDRINELGRKAKLAPLSPSELEEQNSLREEYMEYARAQLWGKEGKPKK